MKQFFTLSMAVGVAIATLATSALAHTTIRQTTPPDGAVLSESPHAIEIAFEHRAQLTSVVLVTPGHHERKVGFEPVGSSLEFRLADPELAPGRNEVHWKGLSEDGHVIEGTLVYVVEPAKKTP